MHHPRMPYNPYPSTLHPPSKFGLKMYVGTTAGKSKSFAKNFPAMLKEKQEQNKTKNLLPDIELNNNTNFIHFVQDFKNLGSIIYIIIK